MHSLIPSPVPREGHTSTTYDFNYTYTVGGTDYASKYSAVNEKGERYLDEPFITVAYSNADPAKVGALHVLKRQSSLGGTIKGVLIAALLFGLIALFVYGWASPDADETEAPEAARA